MDLENEARNDLLAKASSILSDRSIIFYRSQSQSQSVLVSCRPNKKTMFSAVLLLLREYLLPRNQLPRVVYRLLRSRG
jgi:hypothetical protein